MARDLTRFDPFSDIARFGSMEDLLRNFPLRSLMPDEMSQPSIRIDVKEDDQAYTVRADLPGVNKDDISVDIRGNQVSITAEFKREKEEKEGDYLRSERYFGRQSRSFSLAHELNEAEATAKYQDGVLELVVPKKSETGKKKITIN